MVCYHLNPSFIRYLEVANGSKPTRNGTFIVGFPINVIYRDFDYANAD